MQKILYGFLCTFNCICYILVTQTNKNQNICEGG